MRWVLESGPFFLSLSWVFQLVLWVTNKLVFHFLFKFSDVPDFPKAFSVLWALNVYRRGWVEFGPLVSFFVQSPFLKHMQQSALRLLGGYSSTRSLLAFFEILWIKELVSPFKKVGGVMCRHNTVCPPPFLVSMRIGICRFLGLEKLLIGFPCYCCREVVWVHQNEHGPLLGHTVWFQAVKTALCYCLSKMSPRFLLDARECFFTLFSQRCSPFCCLDAFAAIIGRSFWCMVVLFVYYRCHMVPRLYIGAFLRFLGSWEMRRLTIWEAIGSPQGYGLGSVVWGA